MNCPEVTERLPWLLNDTLPAAQRAQLLQHLEDCPQCRLQLQESAAILETMDVHPPAGRLVEYVFGTGMEIPERVSIDRHLSTCARCAQEYDLLCQSHKEMPSRSPWNLRTAAIAALLALTASAGILLSRIWQDARLRESALQSQVRELEDRIARISRPSASGRVVDLLPFDSRQRSSAPTPATPAATAGIDTTFLLSSRLPRNARTCSIRLSAAGRELWAAPQALRGENSEFLVRVPAGFLTPGPHRLHIACEAAAEAYDFIVK